MKLKKLLKNHTLMHHNTHIDISAKIKVLRDDIDKHTSEFEVLNTPAVDLQEQLVNLNSRLTELADHVCNSLASVDCGVSKVKDDVTLRLKKLEEKHEVLANLVEIIVNGPERKVDTQCP